MNLFIFFSRNAAILGQPFFFARTEERSSCATIIFPDGTTSSSGCERTHKVDLYWAPCRHSQRVENAFVLFCEQNDLSGELTFADGSRVIVDMKSRTVWFWVASKTMRVDWIQKYGNSVSSLEDLAEAESYYMDSNWYELDPA